MRMKITTGFFVAAVLLMAGAASAAEPGGEQGRAAPLGAPAPASCLPDPLGLQSGEHSLGDVVDDAFAHSAFGRIGTALTGGEQADFALPALRLLPDAKCFTTGGLDARIAAPDR